MDLIFFFSSSFVKMVFDTSRHLFVFKCCAKNIFHQKSLFSFIHSFRQLQMYFIGLKTIFDRANLKIYLKRQNLSCTYKAKNNPSKQFIGLTPRAGISWEISLRQNWESENSNTTYNRLINNAICYFYPINWVDLIFR